MLVGERGDRGAGGLGRQHGRLHPDRSRRGVRGAGDVAVDVGRAFARAGRADAPVALGDPPGPGGAGGTPARSTSSIPARRPRR